MPTTSAHLRHQIEAVLAHRIPSALTPAPYKVVARAWTGIAAVDSLLEGGLPVGAITEMVGAECSGRTSLAVSFLSCLSAAGRVSAWVDVNDAFDPESAAAARLDLNRLLWVRCGGQADRKQETTATNCLSLPEKYFAAPAIKKGLHGGGHGTHPRQEGRGLSIAVGKLLQRGDDLEQERRLRPGVPNALAAVASNSQSRAAPGSEHPGKPWSRMEQALRVTDLLLQGGGFSAIVLDMGGVAPEHAARVPLATWFRYRAAAERTQCSLILLTQHGCAKSSAGLVFSLRAEAVQRETTVFTGQQHTLEVHRKRCKQDNVVPMRKPPQSERRFHWQGFPAWVGDTSYDRAAAEKDRSRLQNEREGTR